MRDGVNRKSDPVLHSDLAHQFGNMGLNRTLFDTEGGADFLVGADGNQHFQYFLLPNIESTRRGAQTEPWFTTRMACTNSAGEAASSTYPFAPEAIAFKMVSSSMPEPVTMIRRSGRLALRLAIRSNRFWPLRLPRSTRSMLGKLPMSGNEAAISSKSVSESNRARNPTKRSGSLSTTARRMAGFFTGEAFMAVAAFIGFPV